MTYGEDRQEKILFEAQQAWRKASCDERGTPYFECPDCHFVSPNPNDITNQYCTICHQFQSDFDRWLRAQLPE